MVSAAAPTSRRSVRAVHWLSPRQLTRWFSRVIIAVAILGAAVPIAGRQGLERRAGHVTVGEGFSWQAPADGIDVAYRMFSVPELPEICSKARAAEVVRLRSQLPALRAYEAEDRRAGCCRCCASASAHCGRRERTAELPYFANEHERRRIIDGDGSDTSPLPDPHDL
jgi:hypothetical protein